MNTYLNKCIKNRFGPWTILFLLFFLISIPGSYISQVSLVISQIKIIIPDYIFSLLHISYFVFIIFIDLYVLIYISYNYIYIDV